jgi:hypothetical protein
MTQSMDAIRKSSNSVIENAKNARKQYDNLWKSAARAPMFCKITKKTLPGGKTKKTYRSSRLIGGHAYNIAASGAAAYVSNQIKNQCHILREDALKESPHAPWIPTITKGAKMVLEQFLCALTQEATNKAHIVRQSSGTTTRLSQKHMEIGWKAVFETVFSGSSIMSKSMYVAEPQNVINKNNKFHKGHDKNDEYDDYIPPEDEEVADEEVADEEVADNEVEDEE